MKILAVLLAGLFFVGCAKNEPTIIYKDKLVPVKCNAVLPAKPNYNGEFDEAKAKMIYFLEVESLLKQCVGVSE